MNLDEIKQWIAEGDTQAVENAWMQAVERGAPPEEMHRAAEALVEAGGEETAATLAWMYLSEYLERCGAAETLEAARLLLPLLPGIDDLRAVAVDLYREVHRQAEHFEDILRDSGLAAAQSLRRAVRTLDTCLAIRPGSFLVNRYDARAVRVEGFDPATGQFELAAPDGGRTRLEPKLLADEFEPAGETDFRVLCGFRAGELSGLLQDDPAAVLVGICVWRGGEIGADALKDLLVPRYLEGGKWSGWWGRARTAIKRSPNLTLEGRNPAVIRHHPHGRTLEQELAAAVREARVPTDYLAVLRDYAREVAARKLRVDEGFVRPIMRTLAEQAEAFRARRPADALAASLVIDAATNLALPGPEIPYPTARQELAEMTDPAAAVAAVDDRTLWPAALDALAARPDAGDHLEKLLRLVGPDGVGDVVARLRDAGRADAVERAVADADARPAEHLPILLWVWRGAEEAPAAGSRLEQLSRLLGVVQELHRDWDMARADRRDAFQQVRAALLANDCATFRAALREMDEDVAETIKRRIERCEGLSDVARDDLLGVLREEFGRLFVTAKVAPWLDENALWTTAAARDRQQDILKDLLEVKLPANARAIGAAAALGDLSENSEWENAVEEQRRLNDRVLKLQGDLARARTIDPHNIPADSVGIGSRVVLQRLADGAEVEATFLGPWDSDVDRRIYSYQTPLAQALMGRKIGEVVSVKLDGQDGEFLIARVAPGV